MQSLTAATVPTDNEERNDKKMEKSSANGDSIGENGSKTSLNPFDDDDEDTKNPFNEDDEKKPHPEPRSPQKGDIRQEAVADRKVLLFTMICITKIFIDI